MSKRAAADRDRFMKFYPSDWRGDDELQACSLEARGAWWELCCLAFKYDGVVLVAGEIPTVDELARQIKATKAQTTKVIAELLKKGVASKREDGALFSRRLVRDARKRAINKANGRLGGNPLLFDLDKPPDDDSVGDSAGRSVGKSDNRNGNPQKPETRTQTPEPRAQGADRSRSTNPSASEPAWRAPEPRPRTLVEPRRAHANCYDAPTACARGLCLPRFLGQQWEAQLGAGQPEGYSASGAVVARVNAIIGRVPAGTTVADPLPWWRAQWTDGVQASRRLTESASRQHAQTWDDGVEELLDRIGLQKFFRCAWFQHARLEGDVLFVRTRAVEWIETAYLDQMIAAHGGALHLEALAEEAVPA